MELVEYFDEFCSIYEGFFDIPYEVTMSKVMEEYMKIFKPLPSLMESLYLDIKDSKVGGKTVLYEALSREEVGYEFKAALKLWPTLSEAEGDTMGVTFGDIDRHQYGCTMMLMDRDSVLIFSCYCIFLNLSYFSKIKSSEDSAFLELCSRKIPKIFDEVKEMRFRTQFEDLFGINYYKIMGKGLVDSVIKTAKEILYNEKISK